MTFFFRILSPRYFYMLALVAALAGLGAGSASAQRNSADSFNREFWDSAEKSANAACLKNGKQSSKGKVADEAIVRYCDCTIKASFQAITTVEALKSYFAGQMSPEFKAKLQESARACAREAFPPSGASAQ